MTYSKTINKPRIYKAKTLVLKYTADFHYTRIYNHHHYLTPKRVQYPQNLCPLTSHPPFHPHSPSSHPDSLLLRTHLCKPNIVNLCLRLQS